MIPVSLLLFAIVRMSSPPFVLQLCGDAHASKLKPNILNACFTHKRLSVCSSLNDYIVFMTSSGHNLVMAPLAACRIGKTPMQVLEESGITDGKEIKIADCVNVFESEHVKFRCFLTNHQVRTGIAARIDGTFIWILISDCMGLVECNQCASSISLSEFEEIQNAYANLAELDDAVPDK